MTEHRGRVSYVVRTIACAAVLVGCSTDPMVSPGQTAQGILFPLSVGTRWTYDRVDSVEFTTDTLLKSFHSTVSFGVLADTVGPAGTKWAVLENTSDVVGGLNSGHEYVANFSGGTWTWLVPTGSAFGSALPALLDYPYPAARGTTSSFGTVTVLASDSTVTVPAGTFHCMVCAASRDRIFVAPGVGVVWRSQGDITALDSNGKLQGRFQAFFFLRSVAIH